MEARSSALFGLSGGLRFRVQGFDQGRNQRLDVAQLVQDAMAAISGRQAVRSITAEEEKGYSALNKEVGDGKRPFAPNIDIEQSRIQLLPARQGQSLLESGDRADDGHPGILHVHLERHGHGQFIFDKHDAKR